jgi:hypothetical protein
MSNYYDCYIEGIDLTYVKMYARRYFNFELDIDNNDLEDIDVLIAFMGDVSYLLEEMYRANMDIDDIYKVSVAYKELEKLLDLLMGYDSSEVVIEAEEEKAAKLIDKILSNIETIERVGNLFGIEIYDVTKEDLYNEEFVNIFASIIRQLDSSMYSSDSYENFINDEDTIIEVFVAINTLQQLLQVIRSYKEQF